MVRLDLANGNVKVDFFKPPSNAYQHAEISLEPTSLALIFVAMMATTARLQPKPTKSTEIQGAQLLVESKTHFQPQVDHTPQRSGNRVM